MNLQTRLELVTERQVLFQILNDVQKDPEEYQNVIESFCKSLNLFGKFLTAKELTTKIEPILAVQDPIRAIIAFSKCISRTIFDSFRDVMTVLEWLKFVVEQHMERAICDSLKVNETDEDTLQLYREFAVACINLPEKISNCRALAGNEEHNKYIESAIWLFKMSLFQGIQKAMFKAHDCSERSNHRTLAELLSAGRNMELEKFPLLSKTMEWLETIEKFDSKWRLIMYDIFMIPTHQGTQVHESLLTSVFLTAKNEQQLKRCIDVKDLNGTLKRVVTVKLPLQRILSPWNIKLLVDFIIRTKESFAVNLLETAVKVWSDNNYARKAAEGQEQHMVRLILYLIHRLKKRSSIPWSDLFLIASNGVRTRMELLPTSIRSGLFINKTLLKLASSNLPQEAQAPPTPEDDEFEINIAGIEWNEEMKSIVADGIKDPKIKKEPTSSPTKFKKFNMLQKYKNRILRRGKVKRPVDSDDDEDVEEEEEEIEEDEDFPLYSVDDSEKDFRNLEVGEEPKTKVRPPPYIADAYEQLLEKEKYEVFEAAFFHLPILIRKKAIGFPQLAEKIVLRALLLPNNFGTRQFNETIEEIVVACISLRPECVPALVTQIIQPEQGEGLQLRLLHYIHKAADEMGRLDRRQAVFVEKHQRKLQKLYPKKIIFDKYGNSDTEELEDEEEEPNWREVVDARVRAKTKLLSERAVNHPGVPNRLGQSSRFMFFPLLILPRGERASLLHRDSDLLSMIIMVASMIYVRSGVTPNIMLMSHELISYVTPHRFSENAKVRAACLSAHINVMALLPSELLMHLFPVDTRRQWLEWVELVLDQDVMPPVEAEMAGQLHRMILEQFQESQEIQSISI
ncbi:unnamed protein product [Caenorhabditis sp. 36 PRJEB53466]|nr:unnamed protein product [Caenorhabditis sp. 36 PRJEB53466]